MSLAKARNSSRRIRLKSLIPQEQGTPLLPASWQPGTEACPGGPLLRSGRLSPPWLSLARLVTRTCETSKNISRSLRVMEDLRTNHSRFRGVRAKSRSKGIGNLYGRADAWINLSPSYQPGSCSEAAEGTGNTFQSRSSTLPRVDPFDGHSYYRGTDPGKNRRPDRRGVRYPEYGPAGCRLETEPRWRLLSRRRNSRR